MPQRSAAVESKLVAKGTAAHQAAEAVLVAKGTAAHQAAEAVLVAKGTAAHQAAEAVLVETPPPPSRKTEALSVLTGALRRVVPNSPRGVPGATVATAAAKLSASGKSPKATVAAPAAGNADEPVQFRFNDL